MLAGEVLVLYESSDRARLSAVMLQNLLGGCPGVEGVRLQLASAYQPREATHSLRTFYLGIGATNPDYPALVRDAIGGAPITWIEDSSSSHASLASRFQPLGITRTGGVKRWQGHAAYRDRRFASMGGNLSLITASSSCVIHASVTIDEPHDTRGNHEPRPFIVQSGAFWFVAGDPLFELKREKSAGLYRVACDLLGSMVTPGATELPKTIFRLEDLSPAADIVSLGKTLDVLEECGVPFVMTVVPLYVSPDGVQTTWRQAPHQLALVKRAQAIGGTSFQHGYTHQYKSLKNPTGGSLIDWEFWDKPNNLRIKGFFADEAMTRITEGRAILEDVGIHPQGWTTPHYLAPGDVYAAVSRLYPLALERRKYALGRARRGQLLPYPVKDAFGAWVLPENAGYIHAGNRPADILALARTMKALQRPWVVSGLQAEGYEFANPKDYVTTSAPRAAGAPPIDSAAPLAIVDQAANARFRAIATAMNLDPDHLWVGGYADFAWKHSRPHYASSLPWISGRAVLELGFNIGATSIMLAMLGAHVTAVEVDPKWVELARANAARYGVASRIDFVQLADTRSLPYLDNAFDLVSCNSVLEYVPHAMRRGVLAEIDRVLRPGGRVMVVGTSNRMWPREGHSQKLLVNYLPRFVDHVLPPAARPQRGVFPWELRAGLGLSYRRIAPPQSLLQRVKMNELWQVSKWIKLTFEKGENRSDRAARLTSAVASAVKTRVAGIRRRFARR
ncbi:MAG: DUF2334 domain-containing protein [Proteobacteria bacterium]|nr:DUF2334 domain-containing protein [Pseudomonadota bacterium]